MIDGYARAFVVEDENKQGIIHYNVSFMKNVDQVQLQSIFYNLQEEKFHQNLNFAVSLMVNQLNLYSVNFTNLSHVAKLNSV